MRQQLPPQRD